MKKFRVGCLNCNGFHDQDDETVKNSSDTATSFHTNENYATAHHAEEN